MKLEVIAFQIVYILRLKNAVRGEASADWRVQGFLTDLDQ